MEIVKEETQTEVKAEKNYTPLECWQMFQSEQIYNVLVPNGFIKLKGHKENFSNIIGLSQPMIDSVMRTSNNIFGKFFIEVGKKIDDSVGSINKEYQKLYEQRAPIKSSWWRRNVLQRTLYNYLNKQIEIEQEKANTLMDMRFFIISITPKKKQKTTPKEEVKESL